MEPKEEVCQQLAQRTLRAFQTLAGNMPCLATELVRGGAVGRLLRLARIGPAADEGDCTDLEAQMFALLTVLGQALPQVLPRGCSALCSETFMSSRREWQAQAGRSEPVCHVWQMLKTLWPALGVQVALASATAVGHPYNRPTAEAMATPGALWRWVKDTVEGVEALPRIDDPKSPVERRTLESLRLELPAICSIGCLYLQCVGLCLPEQGRLN